MDKILSEIKRLYIEERLSIEKIAEMFEWKTNASVYRLLRKIEDDDIRNERHKRRSESHKGQIVTEEQRKMIGDHFRGKRLTKEHAEKISKALTGQKHTDERKRNNSLSKQGKPLKSDKQLNVISKMADTNRGKVMPLDQREKISRKRKKHLLENPSAKERLLSNLNRGTKKTLEQKGINDLEKIVADELIRRGIHFEHDKSIEQYFVDFYLSAYNLIIECDGGWHKEKDVIEHDLVRDARIRSLGYSIVRLPRRIIKPNNMPSIIKSILGE